MNISAWVRKTSWQLCGSFLLDRSICWVGSGGLVALFQCGMGGATGAGVGRRNRSCFSPRCERGGREGFFQGEQRNPARGGQEESPQENSLPSNGRAGVISGGGGECDQRTIGGQISLSQSSGSVAERGGRLEREVGQNAQSARSRGTGSSGSGLCCGNGESDAQPTRFQEKLYAGGIREAGGCTCCFKEGVSRAS